MNRDPDEVHGQYNDLYIELSEYADLRPSCLPCGISVRISISLNCGQ